MKKYRKIVWSGIEVSLPWREVLRHPRGDHVWPCCTEFLEGHYRVTAWHQTVMDFVTQFWAKSRKMAWLSEEHASRGKPTPHTVCKGEKGRVGHDRTRGVYHPQRCSQQKQSRTLQEAYSLAKYSVNMTSHKPESRVSVKLSMTACVRMIASHFESAMGDWTSSTAFLNDLNILHIRISSLFFCMSWPYDTRRKIPRWRENTWLSKSEYCLSRQAVLNS